MSLKGERDKEFRQYNNKSKNSTPSNTYNSSNRSSFTNQSPYSQIKSQIQKLFDINNYHKQSKDSSRNRPKGSSINQTSTIKCFMHQPIINNFIHISQDEPTRFKTTIKQEKKRALVERKQFNYKYIIGKGGFGKVWKVENTKTRHNFAMKQMLKSIVLTKKSVQSIINEQKLLSKLYSPFIVNMHYAFQDRETLYLVLDIMEGGDLRHHLSVKTFSELQSKFFIACIILGLDYIHNNKIIHRDIKPQNLVLDSRGYVRVTDLGIARMLRSQNSSDTSGTPGYMSPQVICRQNHSFVSDFFALGVIAYELMLGRRPYNGNSRQQIRQNILSRQASIKAYEVPHGWSMDSMDFANKLLQRKPEQRLGFKGIEELKFHPWLNNINWKSLYKKQLESPFIPFMKKNDFDQDQKITVEDQQEAEMIEKNGLLLRKPEFQELFKQYYFDEQDKKVFNEDKTFGKTGKSNVGQKSNRQSPKTTDFIFAPYADNIQIGKPTFNGYEKQSKYLSKDNKF